MASRSATARGSRRTWIGARVMFSSDRHVRIEIELLEHHADLGAQPAQIGVRRVHIASLDAGFSPAGWAPAD